jgi:hypothetical protein
MELLIQDDVVELTEDVNYGCTKLPKGERGRVVEVRLAEAVLQMTEGISVTWAVPIKSVVKVH